MNAVPSIPALAALVLAGGRSTRMGQDKGMLRWHGKPQREYLVDLLENLGLETWISCRTEQLPELARYRTLTDKEPDLGPLGGIWSALQMRPATAWLVVACDLPLLDLETLRFLVSHRNPEAAATAFRAPAFQDGSPDPLCAIWEPQMMPVLEERMAAGKRCARKTLIQGGVHLLEPPRAEALQNANTPEEAAALLAQLAGSVL